MKIDSVFLRVTNICYIRHVMIDSTRFRSLKKWSGSYIIYVRIARHRLGSCTYTRTERKHPRPLLRMEVR